MAASKQVVGNPTPRVEGELKVSGHAKYAVDITLPGMLWGRLLRSPIASGKIKRIDTSKTEELPPRDGKVLTLIELAKPSLTHAYLLCDLRSVIAPTVW